ncbi:prepilin-type N-terminal cleavage/methylation domain-containing protein [Candidatus Peregrinibacteria bacterium]|nr:prepilin-type N-terminal cleavage/methylation domain-containing protein [Candidatus Peregrinibacteria bacterium]
MRNKKGFTLIELLIVIAIIGILSAALLPTILNAPARGRDAARQGHLNSIVAALETYNSDFGKYPSTSGCVGSETVFADDDGDNVLNNYFAGGTPPTDPSGGRTLTTDPGNCAADGQYYYGYVGEVGVAEYVLGTVMEVEQNNNSDTNPAEVDETSTGILDCTDECEFYVLVQ